MQPIRLEPNDKQLEQIALNLLRASDWLGLVSLVQAMPPQSAYVAIRLLANAAPTSTDIRPLIEHGTLGLTIAGALLHGRALRVRGLDQAENVSDDQWELYLPTLARSQELLAEANRQQPELGLTAAWRVTAYVDATEVEKDEAEIALRHATDVPVSGLSRLITMRSEKWGGSHDEMWRVVAEYADRDPPGSLGLFAKAHFEQHLWFAMFDEDVDAVSKANAYYSQETVRQELHQASLRVLSTELPSDPRALLFADNCFAVAFWSGQLARDARPHLKRLGSNIDRDLWLFNSPWMEMNRARLSARLFPVLI